MVRIDDIARAAVNGDALRVRSLIQDCAAASQSLAQFPPPIESDPAIRAVAAALVELFASRSGEQPPAWTAQVGPLAEPLYLVKLASSMPRLKRLCEQEAPEPLRRRRIYATPDYLLVA